jgi:osmotically-inducible protein OsmY
MKYSWFVGTFLVGAVGVGALAQTGAASAPAHAEPPPALGDAGSTQTLGRKAADAIITVEAKAALIGASGVNADDIDVTTHDGMVILTGIVGHAQQKAEAERLVAGIDGVTSIRNALQVHRAARASAH